MLLSALFWGLCLTTLGAWLLSGYGFFRNREDCHLAGERLLFAALLGEMIFLIINYIELGKVPFESLEGLFWFLSFAIIGLYFVVDFYFPNRIFEVIFPPLALFFLLSSLVLSDQSIGAQHFLEKSPVFGKVTLFVHASSTMVGYLLFGVGCLASIFFLVQEKQIKQKKLHLSNRKIPSLGYLDGLNYKAIATGFFLITIGLLLGVIMKIISFQGHPSLSTRQILPLATWAVYAAFLLNRSIKGDKGKVTAIWSMVGFAAAVVSFAYEISILLDRV